MILGISGSATPQSSTDILIGEALKGAGGEHPAANIFRLNEMNILPCQACGKSPEPEYCFFHDDALVLLKKLATAKATIFGSPVYFDSVSAQAKIFIDRSNCLRPADFTNPKTQHFKKPLFAGKKGGLILVASNDGKFDSALRTMRAFFIWAGIEIKFELTYKTTSLEYGQAAKDDVICREAFQSGKTLMD
jgi:multimeric flavodoxin WrbA